jgi:hypothetical protein
VQLTSGNGSRAAPCGGRRPAFSALYINDLARCIGRVEQTADVGAITGYHVGPQSSRRIGHYGVHYVSRAHSAEQTPSRVRPPLGQAHDLTTPQQPPELDLGW